jgi:hypothetical protein
MKINLIALLIITIFSCSISNNQTPKTDIERLLLLDGTIEEFDTLIDQNINALKQVHSDIPKSFWKKYKNEIVKENLESLKKIMIPIYRKAYTSDEIKELITFYESPIGKTFLSKNNEAFWKYYGEALNDWSNQLEKDIQARINADGLTEKHKETLEILNQEITFNKSEFNGGYIIDFDDISEKINPSRGIKIRNNSQQEIAFLEEDLENSFYKFKWDKEPIKAGETKEIEFELKTICIEGDNYFRPSIKTTNGETLFLVVKWICNKKQSKFIEINNRQRFVGTIREYSEPIIFKIKNTGKISIVIKDVKMNKPFAYLHYDENEIGIGQEAEIKVIYSQKLMKNSGETNFSLKLKASVIKCSQNVEHVHFRRQTSFANFEIIH